MIIRSEIKQLLSEVRNNRRQLHKIPEIGLNTVLTKEYLIQQLSKYGVDEIRCGYAIQGIVVRIKGINGTHPIGFRSDMDGLKIKDETLGNYQSKHIGNSHSCGHDGHMALQLGLIHYICLHKKTLREDVVFIFQPGEEGPGGAREMIEDGLFHDYPIDIMIGYHLLGSLALGNFACKAGPLMALSGELHLTIIGKSAHAGFPYLGKDSIVISSILINQIQSIISRNIDPLSSAIISLGMIQGGTAINQIASSVKIDGSIRSLDNNTYEAIKVRLYEVCRGMEQGFGCEILCEIHDFYKIVSNDHMLNNILKDVSNEDYVETTPMMMSEDFSFYQEKVPGLFYFIGTKDKKYNANLHESNFDFNEEALLYGIECNVRILEKLNIL
ncbi:MAG: amidohydrolase [Erysipelotrichaceae bacterium]